MDRTLQPLIGKEVIMKRMSYALALTLALNLGTIGGVAAAAPPAADQATTASTVREHLDEAEDLVESMLRWKHVAIWPMDRTSDLPVDAPKSTLISIDRQEAAKLGGLIGAIVAQLPASPGANAAAPRGDLRAHAEKAQEICKELLPESKSAATGNLVTIDRTALMRLEIELDAVEELLPRTMPTRDR
jgi:hypothetical protein